VKDGRGGNPLLEMDPDRDGAAATVATAIAGCVPAMMVFDALSCCRCCLWLSRTLWLLNNGFRSAVKVVVGGGGISSSYARSTFEEEETTRAITTAREEGAAVV